MGIEVFDMEKPVVFTYDEIIFSTDSFADSNLLGHETYGSVYYALLRYQLRKLLDFVTVGCSGNTSLSWIVRVQIALDTARGLECIHEHTKIHYVHRDIKTSNILIDSAFRGKVTDFGLAKLVGKTSEGEASTTRVVALE
ncbi:hypothetical protein IFM89_001256 [Coptis chinensis]|uniref:non-specific serine/threonine protein kinase n=1 Tax=Coptis chinensis TaxID=261450 RepID=A0A835H0N5_9MAGN|nr:hypothetical protein IFM89_001256 [Coptis chinensis]